MPNPPKPPDPSLASPSLFSPSYADWENQPEESLVHWMNEQGLAASSQKVYKSMWCKFNKWRKERGLSLGDVSSRHLDAFLDQAKKDSAPLEKHHRYRYVRLIERVYAALARHKPGLVNPGSKAAKENVGRGMNDASAFLTRQQRVDLIHHLTQGEEREKKNKATEWREVRDRAIAAVILGGGIKAGEIRQMSVNCVIDGGEWLEIRHGKRLHRTRLLPFAKELLARWVEVRAASGTEGDVLFPSAVKFPKALKIKKGETPGRMSSAALYRLVKRELKAAGVELDARQAPQTLRNTFAAMLFDAGESDGLVAEYLGIKEPSNVGRLRAHYKLMGKKGNDRNEG